AQAELSNLLQTIALRERQLGMLGAAKPSHWLSWPLHCAELNLGGGAAQSKRPRSTKRRGCCCAACSSAPRRTAPPLGARSPTQRRCVVVADSCTHSRSCCR